MLKELYIENLAVIERLSLTLGTGLTVFTGETGAGKSILIDAINLVLGQRANKELVRTGAEKAVVSAVFDVGAETEDRLREYGYESENGELLISREIGTDGKSSARLMGRPVTVSILRELGAQLVNIHGQHDNQLLLDSSRHLEILDLYAGLEGTFAAYQGEYRRYQALKQEWRSISMDEQEKARRIDLLTYQTEEIAQADPKPGEEEQLAERLGMIRNAARISEQLNAVHAMLYGAYDEESGACDLLRESVQALEETGEYHREIQKMAEQLRNAQEEAEDVAGAVSRFLDHFEFDPQELDQLEHRLEELEQLKRKYGTTLEEVLAYYEAAVKELDQIELSEERRQELSGELDAQKKRVMEAGKALSQQRQEAARRFVGQVSDELRFLDMPNVSMRVRIDKTKYGPRGCDEVEFLFSTNRGEELRSLSKIASGGELSRIMLAIKSVLAEKDGTGTLIFDEIDTGVSGQSAQKIGLKLRGVAGHRQVLCVTHSAQVAALAQQHLLIYKQTDGERTYTRVKPLDDAGRIGELSRIMGTGRDSDAVRNTAREMLAEGKHPAGC